MADTSPEKAAPPSLQWRLLDALEPGLPWLLLGVLWLFAYTTPRFAGVHMSLPVLFAPVAAWLGHRYGGRGIAAVLLCSLFFVLGFESSAGRLGGATGYLLASFVLAVLAAQRRPLVEVLNELIPNRTLVPAAVGVLLLLPIGLTLYTQETSQGVRVFLRLDMWPLFYLSMFLLGLRRMPWQTLLAALALAVAVGWTARMSGLLDWVNEVGRSFAEQQSSDGYLLQVGYGIFHFSTILTTLAAVSAGYTVSRSEDGMSEASWLWRRPYAAVAALMLLWGWPQEATRILSISIFDQRVYLLGSFYALVIAAFMSGYLLLLRGVALVFWLVVFMTVLNQITFLLIRGSFAPSFQIESFLIPLGFGWLGMRVRDPTAPLLTESGRRQIVYVVSILFFTPVIFDLSTELGAIGAVVFVIVAILLAVAASYLRRLSLSTEDELNPKKWVGFTIACLITVSLLSNLQEAGQTLLYLWDAILGFLASSSDSAFSSSDFQEETVIIALAYLTAILFAVIKLVSSVPTISRELMKVIRLVRHLRSDHASA